MNGLLELFRRRKEPEREAPAESRPVRFRARGFSFLLEDLPGGRPWRILDLGEADNVNLNFFAGQGARYTVESLYRGILPCRRSGTFDVDCLARRQDFLRFDSRTEFDAILAWDLLDYLPPGGLDLVASRLAPVAGPSTLLYSVVSREPKLPPRPARCRIVDGETVEMTHETEVRTFPGPRYTQAQLDESLTPFRVERSYLLKIHAQEVLLRTEDSTGSAREGVEEGSGQRERHRRSPERNFPSE